MKILVVHASAGAGHLKAAEALYDGLKKLPEGHEVVLLDALDKTTPAFKKLYRESYFFLISRIPFIWGVSFAFIDFGWIQPLVRAFRRLYNSINVKGFQDYLVKEQFDCVFSTHFMPNEVISALKRKGLVKTRLVSAVTDFDVHKIWLADGVDMYSVASPWTRQKLIKIGVPEDKVVMAGIPTNEKFSEHPDKGELKRKLGLEENIFTVLIATGSFGIGPIEEIVQAVDGACQTVVVCGHNETLYKNLSEKQYKRVKVFPLVDNMFELMELSDMMITKPGGLSISEALVKNLPMIFFNAIPGQETNNIFVLKQSNVGLSGLSIEEIAQKIKEFASNEAMFNEALENAKRLARPNAVQEIIALRNA